MEPVCGFCGQPEHNGSPCKTIVPRCVNCKQNHHSLDIKCPKFVEEKEIKAIQFREKIPYGAAKKKYKDTNAEVKSYAEAARKVRKIDVGVQTEEYISTVRNQTDLTQNSSLAQGNTGLSPLQPLASSLTPTLPLASSSPIPPPEPLGPPSPPVPQGPSSLSTSTNSPPQSTASGSTDPMPPSNNELEKSVDEFKTPPPPNRNSGKNTNKQAHRKNQLKQSEEDMDTI